MSIIGHFTATRDGGWTGVIRTLSLNAKVSLLPNDARDHENTPAFRVVMGNIQVGDAWEARTRDAEPRDYLRVRLDDPGFHEPITAALFPSKDGGRARLVWNRR
jgi:uncharacterized protein (DUF736 family)